MSITKKTMQIYQAAIDPNRPSFSKIGERFGVSKQRVSAIIKQVEQDLGKDAQEITMPPTYPILKNGFRVSQDQADVISETGLTFYSEKIRFLIDFYSTHAEQQPDFTAAQDGNYPRQLGGFYINEEQSAVLDSVPGKNHSRKMRYLIDFYISCK